MSVHEEFNKFVMQIKKRSMLLSAYKHNKQNTKNRKDFLFVVDEGKQTSITHHAIVTTEEGGYLVSVLSQPAKNKDSYVEVMLTEAHPLYERIHSAVGMLNMAGMQTEVPELGEAYQSGVYHIMLNQDEHAALAKGQA